jgi:hypothetical protein
MTHPIIKTENYLLVVDDSEIKEGDWFMANQGAHKCIRVDENTSCPFITLNNKGEEIGHFKTWKNNIIAHLPLNNSPILEGVPLLPPLEDEAIGQPLVDYVNSKHTQEECIGFIAGYNKAREKYKYTEENILIIRNKLVSMLPKGDVSAWDMIFAASNYTSWFVNYIQHLQQPKIPIGFECVMIKWVDELYSMVVEEPKTTTNSQGQTVLVGTYK